MDMTGSKMYTYLICLLFIHWTGSQDVLAPSMELPTDPCDKGEFCPNQGEEIPDPEDCSMFYECVYQSMPWFHRPCSPGTWFDIIQHQCVHQGEALCQTCPTTASSTKATTEITVTEYTTGPSTSSSKITTHVSTYTMETTPPELIPIDPCNKPDRCDIIGRTVPDPYNCQAFYICTNNNTWSQELCDSARQFDKIILECLNETSAICQEPCSLSSGATRDPTTALYSGSASSSVSTVEVTVPPYQPSTEPIQELPTTSQHFSTEALSSLSTTSPSAPHVTQTIPSEARTTASPTTSPSAPHATQTIPSEARTIVSPTTSPSAPHATQTISSEDRTTASDSVSTSSLHLESSTNWYTAISTEDPQGGGGQGGLSGGLIAAIVVPILIFLILLTVLVSVSVMERRKRRRLTYDVSEKESDLVSLPISVDALDEIC